MIDNPKRFKQTTRICVRSTAAGSRELPPPAVKPQGLPRDPSDRDAETRRVWCKVRTFSSLHKFIEGARQCHPQTWYVSGIWIFRVMANFVEFMNLKSVIENRQSGCLQHVTVAVFGPSNLPLYSPTIGNYVYNYYLQKFSKSSWLPCRTSVWNS